MIYLELLIGFLKIGCFSFGGAYSAIPLIREVVLSYGWIDDEKLSYMIAVSESTPGPIMVNMATYVGSSQGGVLGALIATLAVILPAFLIVIIILLAMKTVIKSGVAQAILGGLKSCVIGIILATGAYMVLKGCIGGVFDVNVDYLAIILAVTLSVTYFTSKKIFKNGISPIMLILFSGVLGVLVYGW